MRTPEMWIDQGAGWTNVTAHDGETCALAAFGIEWGTDDPLEAPDPSVMTATLVDRTGRLAANPRTLAGMRVMIRLPHALTWGDIGAAAGQWQAQRYEWRSAHRRLPRKDPADPFTGAGLTLFRGRLNTGGTITRKGDTWRISLKATSDLALLKRVTTQGPTDPKQPGYHWTGGRTAVMREITRRLAALGLPLKTQPDTPPAGDTAPYGTDSYPQLLTVITDTIGVDTDLLMYRLYESFDDDRDGEHTIIVAVNGVARIGISADGRIEHVRDSSLLTVDQATLQIPEPVTQVKINGRKATWDDDKKTVSYDDHEANINAAGTLPANLTANEKSASLDTNSILADESSGHWTGTPADTDAMKANAIAWIANRTLRAAPAGISASSAFIDPDTDPTIFKPEPATWAFTANLFSPLISDDGWPALNGPWLAIGGTIEYDGRRLTSTPTFTPLRTPGDPPAWQDIPDAPLTWQEVKATWAEFEQITR